MGGDHQAVAKKIVGEFREHWDELIVEVKDKSGNPVKIVRHNGIEERSHSGVECIPEGAPAGVEQPKRWQNMVHCLPCYRTWKMRYM